MKDSIDAAYARIREVVRETPLEESALAPGLFFKLEHLQHTGSFKFRGATNKIALLTPEQAAAGVVAASNGNHGLGVAAAARARGVEAEVFVSSQVALAKAERIERYGARIRYAGDDPLAAEVAARLAGLESGRTFISPYNDLDVIAGQGTIAVELLQQFCGDRPSGLPPGFRPAWTRQKPGPQAESLPQTDLDAVFVAVGGGGLIGGIGAYLKAVSPATQIIGCWPENSPVLHECLNADRIFDVAEKPTISESTSGNLEPESVTLGVCRDVIDRAVLVSESEILEAMRLVLETDHWLVEGAAGVAVAAWRKVAAEYQGKSVVIILCGRNLSPRALTALEATVGQAGST